MPKLSDLQNLPDEYRRTLVLIVRYEMELAKRGIYSYRYFDKATPEIANDRIFKGFDTVRKWMEQKGWRVSWKFVDWQGYVSYVFDFFAPMLPQPPQMKNDILIKRYLSARTEDNPAIPERSTETLKALYAKVVPEEYREFILCRVV